MSATHSDFPKKCRNGSELLAVLFRIMQRGKIL